MTARPTRETVEGRAYLDVRNAARRDGRDPAEYLTLYVLEALLARLAASEQSGDFVLKGGVLLAAYVARRPTRDIDLATAGVPNGIEDVLTRIKAITAIPREDGIAFHPESVTAQVIRDDAPYIGVRVSLQATIATANVPFHVDVNFGDPIWPVPEPVNLPLLLGGHLSMLGYRPETILAEKAVTAIDRGSANTRWRDFVDIATLAATIPLDGPTLTEAIRTVAEHRQIAMRPLREALAGMAPLAQSRWSAWRRKQRLDSTAPADFAALLDTCARLTDPILNGTAATSTWDPVAGTWR